MKYVEIRAFSSEDEANNSVGVDSDTLLELPRKYGLYKIRTARDLAQFIALVSELTRNYFLNYALYIDEKVVKYTRQMIEARKFIS